MLIVALVLAVIGLAALVTAVVTGNELIAWVCIAASVIGVLLLIIDAIRERQGRDRPADVSDQGQVADSAPAAHTVDETYETFDAEYPETGTETETEAPEGVDEPESEPEADESEPEADASEPEADSDESTEGDADPDRPQS